MYIYYQKSYEAHDDSKRSRHARAKRIIQRAARARRQRRRRRTYVADALQRLIPGSEQFGGIGLGVEDTVSTTIATRPRIRSSGASLLEVGMCRSATRPEPTAVGPWLTRAFRDLVGEPAALSRSA